MTSTFMSRSFGQVGKRDYPLSYSLETQQTRGGLGTVWVSEIVCKLPSLYGSICLLLTARGWFFGKVRKPLLCERLSPHFETVACMQGNQVASDWIPLESMQRVTQKKWRVLGC